VLSSPRVLFAFAEQGQLPKAVASVHPRFGTPYVAILVYAVVCAGLALSGTFQQLAIMSSAGTLILYFICCCGVLRMRAQNIATEGKPFVVPGGPTVPLLAIALIAYLLWTLSLRERLVTLGFVVVVGAIFAVVARRNVSSHRP
jgi:APA family basic amino acid/polyamine antiporter